MLPTDKISKYFTFKEALFLPSWSRMATTTDGYNEEIERNLIALFHTMDKVRELVGRPIIVHVAYRPETYNSQIGGAKNSQHLYGKAADIHIVGIDCDTARKALIGHLEEFKLRLELNWGKPWIHLDTGTPINGQRTFKP